MLELAAVAARGSSCGVLAEAAGLEPARARRGARAGGASGIVEELPSPARLPLHARARAPRRLRPDPALRRAELHLRVGEALERAHAADPSRCAARARPPLHARRSASPASSAPSTYNLRAAEAAIASAADQEAAARLVDRSGARNRRPTRACARSGRARLPPRRNPARLPRPTRCSRPSLEAATSLGERGLAGASAPPTNASADSWEIQRSTPREAETVAEAGIETFREIGDERDLALAERRLGLALLSQGRVEEACAVLERALVHADASGDRRARRTVIASLVNALFNGPAPVVDAIRRCEELLESSGSDRVLEATVNRGLSAMVAMAGRFDEARELVRKSSLVLDELNLLTRSVYRLIAATAKELIGDRVGAEHELTAAWQGLSGLRGDAVDARAMSAAYDLAQLYCDEGRWEDAERCLDYGRDVPEIKSHTVAARPFAVSARVAAHRGEHAQALELAQRAVELAEPSDLLNLRARVWLALAEVQRTQAPRRRRVPRSRRRSISTSGRGMSPPPRSCARRIRSRFSTPRVVR